MTKRKRKADPHGDARVIQRVNEDPPTREQMFAYVRACADLPRDEREDYFVLHAITWAELFPDHREQGFSAQFRLQALARLAAEGPPLPGWSEPHNEQPGAHLTREALFAAAAVEPVIVRNGEVVFDRASLLKRAFQLAKAPR